MIHDYVQHFEGLYKIFFIMIDCPKFEQIYNIQPIFLY